MESDINRYMQITNSVVSVCGIFSAFLKGRSYYPKTPQDTPGRSKIPKRHIKIPLFVHFYHHFINLKVYFH